MRIESSIFWTTGDAWKFVINENKAAPIPNFMEEVYILSKSEILEYTSPCDSAKAVKHDTNVQNHHGISKSESAEIIEWSVQDIFDRRLNNQGEYCYLVKWVGHADATWKPETNCVCSKEAIGDYMDGYLNSDCDPATQDLNKYLLQIEPIKDEISLKYDLVYSNDITSPGNDTDSCILNYPTQTHLSTETMRLPNLSYRRLSLKNVTTTIQIQLVTSLLQKNLSSIIS